MDGVGTMGTAGTLAIARLVVSFSFEGRKLHANLEWMS